VSGRLLGFAVISSITFTVDLALLTALHGGLRWPLPVAVTVAYVLASGLGYFLKRTLNFRSHGAVGLQVTVCAAVVTVNFLALILGLTPGAGHPGAGLPAGLAHRGRVRMHVHVLRHALAGLPRCRAQESGSPS
jgi:hypothetical protein